VSLTGGTDPDLVAISQRQQATWASGDYHMIGTQIVIVSELLIEALDLRSTERVLDVATGSGNAALAAARRGCPVVGLDYVPALLERARLRAAAEGLEAEFVEGDAEALPFEDASFNVVSSVFGAMFAPDQEQAARELTRVCRTGGRIGLVAHTPEGFIGQLFKTNAKHVPPPVGLRSPVLWGTEERLRELFGDAIAEMHAAMRVLRLPLPFAGGLPGLLAALLRADDEELRGSRRGRSRGARDRLAGPRRPLQSRRRRHYGRAERVP
jgi:SAM-dependent methyltransferase